MGGVGQAVGDDLREDGLISGDQEGVMSPFWKPKYESIETIPDSDVLRIMELVNTIWEIVALAAWEGYLLNGRGAVFCDFDDDTTKYIAEASPVVRATRDPMWRDVRRSCKVYNPEQEVVVVLHHFLHESSTLGMKWPTPDGQLLPPVVYQREIKSEQVRQALLAASRAMREMGQS